MGNSDCFPRAVSALKNALRTVDIMTHKDGYFLLEDILARIPPHQDDFIMEFSVESILTLVRHQAIYDQELEIVLESGDLTKGNRYWIRLSELHRANCVELKSLGFVFWS